MNNYLPPAEPRHLETTAAILYALSDRLAEQAKILAEDPWSDDGEIRLHHNLGLAFDQLERVLISVGVEL
jgi:hypothetical protein